jgi:hypothetical protein
VLNCPQFLSGAVFARATLRCVCWLRIRMPSAAAGSQLFHRAKEYSSFRDDKGRGVVLYLSAPPHRQQTIQKNEDILCCPRRGPTISTERGDRSPALFCRRSLRGVRSRLPGGTSNEIYPCGRSLHCSDHRSNQRRVSTILLLWLTRRHLLRFASSPAGSSRSILLLWLTRRHLLRPAAVRSRFGLQSTHSAHGYGKPPTY